MKADSDDIRDPVRAYVRLEEHPELPTSRDVDQLGTLRLALGLRAAVAFELHRILRVMKPPNKVKPTLRRRKR